jgi:serine/threonine protein kinase
VKDMWTTSLVAVMMKRQVSPDSNRRHMRQRNDEALLICMPLTSHSFSYKHHTDYFSLGVTLFTMVAGRRPFPSRKEAFLSSTFSSPSPSKRRSSITGTNLSAMERAASAAERAAIRKAKRDIEYRCLMCEVTYPDSLESEGRELIAMLLERDPEKRPNFDGIKNHAWMLDVDFDPMRLKAIAMPTWIINHATQESKPKSVRRSTMASSKSPKKGLTMSLFIRNICSEIQPQSAAARWLVEPSSQTVDLFNGWTYISDEARNLEIDANKNRPRGGFLDRISSRRGTSNW